MSIFKKIKKGIKKYVRTGREAWADVARGVGGFVGAPGLGNSIGDVLEPGDTPADNARELQDFEYNRSLADQRAFQDDSVQRRVADARKAGIHPLAALGFSSPGFIPPQTGGYYGESEYGMAEMGQDISRAISAGQTEKERRQQEASMARANVGINELNMRNLELQNESLALDLVYKRDRIMRMRNGTGPGFPNVNAIRNVGLQELATNDMAVPRIGDTGERYPATAKIQNLDGSWTVVPGKDAKQAIEDDPVAEAQWHWANQLKQWLQDGGTYGEHWNYNFDGPYKGRNRYVRKGMTKFNWITGKEYK